MRALVLKDGPRLFDLSYNHKAGLIEAIVNLLSVTWRELR